MPAYTILQRLRRYTATIPWTVLSLLLLTYAAAAQPTFELVPHASPNKQSKPTARPQPAHAMPLPFWDDFSFAGEPADTLWASNETIRVADGYAINPPTLGAAIFDGLNANGTPYNVNVLETGFGDSLVSRKIRLADVPTAQRSTVYLSFKYQWKGNGEAPDEGDYLQVSFLASDKTWVSLPRIYKPDNVEEGRFYDFIAAVDDPGYFHNEFQFKISRFGRLSGAFDTWVVDYVYFNRLRSATDFSFPDRSLCSGLTPIFDGYNAVPKDHFKKTPTITLPTFTVATQERTPGSGDGASVAYSTFQTKRSYTNGAFLESTTLVDDSLGIFVPEEQAEVRSLINLPDTTTSAEDSVSWTLTTILESSDNISIYDTNHPNFVNADYDDLIYAPINFRNNDTTQTTYWLSNYYAYDDGIAEYSVIQAEAGKAAFRFSQLGSESDTLTGVYIYFPAVAGNLSNIVTLLVYDDLGGFPGTELLRQEVAVYREGPNVFSKIYFRKGVIIDRDFFVGWEQPANGKLAVGLDRSVNRVNQLFGNNTGVWSTVPNVRGTLMIRPIFGRGDIITSVDEPETVVDLYPNPAQSSFSIDGAVEVVGVVHTSGLPLDYHAVREGNTTLVSLANPIRGLVIVQMRIGGKLLSRKMILH